MTGNFEHLDGMFSEALKSSEQPTIKDIVDRIKVVVVKCPCCDKTLRLKVRI